MKVGQQSVELDFPYGPPLFASPIELIRSGERFRTQHIKNRIYFEVLDRLNSSSLLKRVRVSTSVRLSFFEDVCVQNVCMRVYTIA